MDFIRCQEIHVYQINDIFASSILEAVLQTKINSSTFIERHYIRDNQFINVVN